MSVYYVDTSALVKRYVPEVGSAWIMTICDPASGNSVVTSVMTRVEAAAAFALKQRLGAVTLGERDAAVGLLVWHATREYDLVAVDDALLDEAQALTQRHRLRGYDAVQLATALIVYARCIAAGLPPLIFVSADRDLLDAAHLEGLLVENPNDHG